MPPPVWRLLACVWTHIILLENIAGPRNLHGFEMFMGKGAITKNCNEVDVYFMGMDYEYNEEHDVLQLRGLHEALLTLMKVKEGGLVWLATPCSSWVWVGRHGTGRKVSEGQVGGDISQQRIVVANLLVGVTTLLACIAWLRGCDFAIENPSGSWVCQMEPLKSFVSYVCGSLKPRASSCMALYGATSLKRLNFWGTWWGMDQFHQGTPDTQLNGEPLEKLTTNEGGWVNGKRKELTESSAYPDSFGKHVAHIMKIKEPMSMRSYFACASA